MINLAKLNADAKKRAFGLEDLPWHLTVDHGKFWSPEKMSHLYHCEVYHELLNDEERRYYNQVYSAGICEQFVFLEEWLLVKGLRQLLVDPKQAFDPDMREAMEIFIDEEIKHGLMFDRLLKLSFPDVYGKSRWDIYQLSRAEHTLMNISLKQPNFFLWWVWVAVFFEEKTLDFYRKYNSPDESVDLDPLYREVHRYHALDEARHFQLDEHFLKTLWDPAPGWKKALNQWIFHRIMRSFAHPRRTVRHAVTRLVARFPRLTPHRTRLLTEILQVSKKTSWQESTYSRRSLPRTFALFDRYPAIASRMADVFPQYRPDEARNGVPGLRRVVVNGP